MIREDLMHADERASLFRKRDWMAVWTPRRGEKATELAWRSSQDRFYSWVSAVIGSVLIVGGARGGVSALVDLGHLVGLAHVNDPHQAMYPTAEPLAHYGDGDQRGLAILGDGPCPTTV